MRLLVTDLTRMDQHYICVAGIDLDTGKRVRPVIDGQLHPGLLSVRGGPFDIRRVVELGPTVPTGSPPETEDVFFRPELARHVQTLLSPAYFQRLLAEATTLDAFGPLLAPAGRSGRALPHGQGPRSLVLARAPEPFEVYLAERPGDRPRLRARFRGGMDLSITDIRLYEPDGRTPDRVRVRWLQQRLTRPGAVILAFGVSRAFKRRDDDQARHWLQLNTIHLETAADWQLRWPQERYEIT